MAEWKETLEPYIKVTERIKTVAQNPTAGENLIIGCTIISDAGPAVPTLITSQKEFLSTYASQDLTQEYIESLNDLYTGSDKTLASTMWSNAYRLAGSNNMLIVRAEKANDIYFAKPLTTDNDESSVTYILRDGELLKKVPEFKIVLDKAGDDANHDQDGWNININGVGIFGNRTTDSGAQYDYFVNNLPDLVDQLNDTSKFFSPSYKFYTNAKMEEEVVITSDSSLADKDSVGAVVFEEVYLGVNVIDKTDERTLGPNVPDGSKGTIPAGLKDGNLGMLYLITCEKNWTPDNLNQRVIDLNAKAYSGFTASEYYALNVYNSATPLKVRIRRFNHDAVMNKEITDTDSLSTSTKSPYTVLTSVLDTYTKKGTEEPSEKILERDFFEIAIWDTSLNSTVSFFNVGNISGRGDMTVAEVNAAMKMISLNLPDDLHALGLNYYDYNTDDVAWLACEPPRKADGSIDLLKIKSLSQDPDGTGSGIYSTWNDLLNNASKVMGNYAAVDNDEGFFCYRRGYNGNAQIFADLTIDSSKFKLLSVSDNDLEKALDLIVLDEVYTVEGLSDLGNTELSFQNYMANIAINDNYFYPISSVNSTNYMTIGNNATKISKDSCKLYMSAPWDIDSGTLGWKYYASPSVLYWEAIARNRSLNREFASTFGQVNSIMQYQKPVTEFNKKSRQLLLSKKVNTVMWNINTQAWNMNDSYTKQSEDNILGEDGNSRLHIRISKAIPSLLRQFIGRKISDRLCTEVKDVIESFYRSIILPMEYTVDAYLITCDYDEELARKNKIKVVVKNRYSRSLKFIDVYNDAYDVGMDFSE